MHAYSTDGWAELFLAEAGASAVLDAWVLLIEILR
jgi:hypothetical protein